MFRPNFFCFLFLHMCCSNVTILILVIKWARYLFNNAYENINKIHLVGGSCFISEHYFKKTCGKFHKKIKYPVCNHYHITHCCIGQRNRKRPTCIAPRHICRVHYTSSDSSDRYRGSLRPSGQCRTTQTVATGTWWCLTYRDTQNDRD